MQAVKAVLASDPDLTSITRLLSGVEPVVAGLVRGKVTLWGSAGQA
ncbi:protein of unknown function [Candidatus Hydrogenisulfobacillus filiaventi]|uniref:Uncharacterized protein n=1 Tax=Candidatus Hydrogenisulfobacillus filiaventi TaxID=2707344 RepID=A0A6F8ZI17_9FIRM|nr:protein of unknown function [Candidatus Hydrogenisulfobacillus filiaventi]